MTFGQRLKKLRREADMTQERLAEYCNVTPQAVSRWETDAVMPDITLLPTFANLFGVTTDMLLDVDITKKEERIREISRRAWAEYNRGIEMKTHKEIHECIHRAVDIVAEGLRFYPDSWFLKDELMKFRLAWFDENIDVLRANQREIVKISEDILENCNDEQLRHKAIENICQFSRIFGLTERAKELTERMPPMYMSQEMLKLRVLEGEELRQMSLWMIMQFLDQISSCIFSLTNDPDMPAEEVKELHRRSDELYRVMFGGDDYSTLFNPLLNSFQGAEKLAVRGDFDGAFEILNAEYERMVKLSENEYKNISPYVHKNAFGMHYANRTVDEWREQNCRNIDDDYLPFIEKYFPEEFRADPRYAAYIAKLREYQAKYGK